MDHAFLDRLKEERLSDWIWPAHPYAGIDSIRCEQLEGFLEKDKASVAIAPLKAGEPDEQSHD